LRIFNQTRAESRSRLTCHRGLCMGEKVPWAFCARDPAHAVRVRSTGGSRADAPATNDSSSSTLLLILLLALHSVLCSTRPVSLLLLDTLAHQDVCMF
jgi:hypothetical protein